MTRRYTRETPEAIGSDCLYWVSKKVRRTPTWVVSRHPDGTTSCGRWWFPLMHIGGVYHDANVAARLPQWIARGEVTPVPVDITREAAKFARAKKR